MKYKMLSISTNLLSSEYLTVTKYNLKYVISLLSGDFKVFFTRFEKRFLVGRKSVKDKVYK